MVPSVMLGEVGGILRLGLRDVLDSAGIAVVADARSAHAALIDLDAVDCRARAAALIASFPGLTVIACSAQRPSMVVLSDDGDGDGEARERPLTAAGLRALVQRAAAGRHG
jgi:hypothetical protein